MHAAHGQLNEHRGAENASRTACLGARRAREAQAAQVGAAPPSDRVMMRDALASHTAQEATEVASQARGASVASWAACEVLHPP